MLAVKTSLGRHLVVSDLSVRLLVGLDGHGQRPEALIPDGPIDQRRIHPGAERVCPAISDHAIPSFDEVWVHRDGQTHLPAAHTSSFPVIILLSYSIGLGRPVDAGAPDRNPDHLHRYR